MLILIDSVLSPVSCHVLQVSTLSAVDDHHQTQVDRLLASERHFVSQMQFGIQRYSSPLLHCIISAQEHATLFQNVDKLVSISDYHASQLELVLHHYSRLPGNGECENCESCVTSSSPGDAASVTLVGSCPALSVGSIYESQVTSALE